MSTLEIILIAATTYIFFLGCVLIFMRADHGGLGLPISFLNPIRNKRVWTNVNWFGVILGTIFLNIVFVPYSLIFWFYKACTVKIHIHRGVKH